MSSKPTYSIKDVAALTGLPASTLRYYESVGLIPAISRGETSGHRSYSESDLNLLLWIACLSATGMSIDHMRQYLANSEQGAAAAAKQIHILQLQADHLVAEQQRLLLRQRYVDVKIAFWEATQRGDSTRIKELRDEAALVAAQLNPTPKKAG
ncbi:MAG: MerR family transcriptional regulator [Propionibacteriaceae bacterium]